MIPSIGKQKILYKDHSQIQFESVGFYTNLAKKIISKMGPTFFNGLSTKMLKDEDAISFVANAIMMGDWRWDKENKDNKQHKSLYSYRNQCGIWAIKTYVTKQYRNKHNNKKIQTNYSLDYESDADGLTMTSVVKDNKQKDPLLLLIEQEDNISKQALFNDLLDSDILSSKQKDYIRLYYYEDMTLDNIGKKYNITREAVRQSIKSALNKIKELI